MEIVDIDIRPGSRTKRVHLSQYDTGNRIGFKVFEDGLAYNLTGLTVSISIGKNDSHIVEADREEIQTELTNYCEFVVTNQMSACYGDNLAELKISNSSGLNIATANFVIEVEKSPTAGGIQSESEINNLERQISTIIDESEQVKETIEEVTEEIVEEKLDEFARKEYVDEEILRVESEIHTGFDSSLSSTSENAVQNKVINSYINSIDSSLSSLNANKADKTELHTGFDSSLSSVSENAVQNKVVKAETDALRELISVIPRFAISVVEELPETGQEAVVYLVPNGEEEPNMYTEYIYVESTWETLGSQRVDLSDYYTKTETDDLLDDKADESYVYSKYETDSRILDVMPDNTLTGNIVTFDDQVPNIPVEDCTVQIQAVQAGSGTPSPDNPRAISGFDNVTMSVTGKNFLPFPYKESSGSRQGITWDTDANGVIHVRGTNSSSNIVYIWLDDVAQIPHFLKKGKSYSVYPAENTAFFAQAMLYGTTNLSILGGYSMIMPDLNDYNRYAFVIGIRGNATLDTYISPMIKEGPYNASEPFELFRGSTHTIPLGQTVYGGWVNVSNGTGKITHGSMIIPQAVELSKVGDNQIVTLSPPGMSTGDFTSDIEAEVLEKKTYVGNYFGVYHTSVFAIVCVPQTYTLSEYNSEVAGTRIVYPLATPIDLTLTPEEIRTLTGTNNIYANSGDISVTYKSKTYSISKVDELLGSKENAPIELTKTLTAGSTSLTFSNTTITQTSTIDVYTDVFGVNIKDMTASTGSLSITFDAQNQNVNVKVVVR